ncbi:MAG: hypothetical protein AAFX57_04435 [Bacteroidota bacterium]
MMSKRLITQYILMALFSIHRAMGQSYFDAAANGTLTVEPSSSYEFLVSGLTWDQSYYNDVELNGNAGEIFSDANVRDALIQPTMAVTGEGTIDLVLIAKRFNEENYCEAGDTNTECDYTRGPVVVYATSIAYGAAGSPSSSQLYDINFTDYLGNTVTADSRQMNKVFYLQPTDIINTSSQSNLAATVYVLGTELTPLVSADARGGTVANEQADFNIVVSNDTRVASEVISSSDQDPLLTTQISGQDVSTVGDAPGCCNISIDNGTLRITGTVVGGAVVVVAVYVYLASECRTYEWDWLGRLINSKACYDDDDDDGDGGGDDPLPPPSQPLNEPNDQDGLFLYIKVSNESTSNMTLSSIQIPGIQSGSQERNITFLPKLKN